MDFKDLVRQKINRDGLREDRRQDMSKDTLDRSVQKKMQTIMIGALASIEQNFGFLWGHNENRPLTQEELQLKDLFDKIRSEILDKGNGQIRNFKQELDLYKIELLKQMIQIPVRPQTKED